MPQIYSSATITHFEEVGESAFAVSRPCIIDRLALNIISGTDLYTLPLYVHQIRRVTYQGWKMYPLPHRELRQSYLSGAQSGRPFWYVFNNIGAQTIKLFPVPAANLAISGNDLYGKAILTDFIIEFFRIPDHAVFQIPHILRRRLLKCYIAKRVFEINNKGQKNSNRDYWRQKWEFLKTTYTEVLDDLNNKPRNLIASGTSQRPYGFTPPPPMLPINKFGIGVDEPY